ncbi:MAG: NUDIX domain-containing protein [Candidatus Diapherotrites archaeon]
MPTLPTRPVKKYHRPHKPPVEKACGAIIYRGKKFLLLRPTRSRYWSAPKGRMEKGENEEQTARREVFEETGLKNIVFYPKFRRVNVYTMMREHGPIERHVIFFLGETKSGDVKLSDEHNAFEWLGFEESIHRVKFPALKAIMFAAAKTIDPGFILTPQSKKNEDKNRSNLKTEK